MMTARGLCDAEAEYVDSHKSTEGITTGYLSDVNGPAPNIVLQVGAGKQHTSL